MSTSWSGSPTSRGGVNNGNQFEPNDAIVAADINACFNNAFYAVDFVQGITAEGGANVNATGTPSVSFSTEYKKFTFNYLKGAAGVDGGRWYSGTAITGTPTSGQSFQTGISNAVVGDMYLNTSTSNTYRCTLGGDENTAKWVYVNNIKGQQGAAGQNGSNGANGAVALTYSTIVSLSATPVENATFTVDSGYFNRTPSVNEVVNIVGTRSSNTYMIVGQVTALSTPNATIKVLAVSNIRGAQGADGRGISSVSKTSTSGLVDTYTISYTNNTTSTYTVTNGKAATVNNSTSNSINFNLSPDGTILNITVG